MGRTAKAYPSTLRGQNPVLQQAPRVHAGLEGPSAVFESELGIPVVRGQASRSCSIASIQSPLGAFFDGIMLILLHHRRQDLRGNDPKCPPFFLPGPA